MQVDFIYTYIYILVKWKYKWTIEIAKGRLRFKKYCLKISLKSHMPQMSSSGKVAPIFACVVWDTLNGPISGVWIHRKPVPSGHSGKECPIGLQKNCFLQPPAAQSALCVLPTTVFRSSLLAPWWRTHLPMQEMRVKSLGRDDPLEKEMASLSSIPA